MQSSLKKSLYLGLAALSFASVASVTANSSNANAAKKHVAAKKVTYKTTDSKLDQSVTFKSTGKNAVYNKPVGKRSVKASLADMKSKANSNSTKDLFMAYQEGVTSKGVHYYKVVSFDKKVRGFVYNKGVAKTNTTVAADKPANATGYLKDTSRFFNKPYGSQFKTSLKNDYKGMNIAADQFTVADAVKVNNDQTYYYVKDTKNELVNGWVNSVYFSNTITDAAKKANDSANAIHVNFVSSQNYGSVLMSKDMNPANLSSTGTYSINDVTDALNNALVGTGYTLQSNAVKSAVAKGATVTVVVDPGSAISLTPANFNGVALSNVGTANQSTDNSYDLNTNKMANLSLTSDQWAQLFNGKTNQAFDFNNFESALLAPNKAWNKFTNNGKTYTYDANLTRNSVENKKLLNANNSTLTFDMIANASGKNTSGKFNIYYDVSNDNTTTTGNGSLTSGQYASQTKVKNALNDFNNGSKKLTDVVNKDYSDAKSLLADMNNSQLSESQATGFNSLKAAAQTDVLNSGIASVNNKLNKNADGATSTTNSGGSANSAFSLNMLKSNHADYNAVMNALKGMNISKTDILALLNNGSNTFSNLTTDQKAALVTVVNDATSNFDTLS